MEINEQKEVKGSNGKFITEDDPLRSREKVFKNIPVEICEGKKYLRMRNEQVREEIGTRELIQQLERSTATS